MKIHEYQAKEILAQHGIPVNSGELATTPAEAEAIARRIGKMVVVKAQVLVGGRGKAGGVKLAQTPAEARDKAQQILGMDIKGITVQKVLVADAADIAQEYYLGAIVDRGTQRVVIMASAAGGVEIEEVARETPEKIHRVSIDPLVGFQDFQARDLGFAMELPAALIRDFVKICRGLVASLMATDASLAEINPLIRTPDNRLLAIDAKIDLDDNGLYRHPELEKLRDPNEDVPAEKLAREAGLNYVPLDGNIGCMVNGSGLAMGTMDAIKLHGGEPANFLDVGGGANEQRVTTAMRIILSDPKVNAVWINIFGGITRGDVVARGILAGLQAVQTTLPIVIRLVGTSSEEGRQILAAAGMVALESMDEAAAKVVALSRERSAQGQTTQKEAGA
ncbi:MAG TPA: ADP-forming succinate--CoA ligase subunit beta [Chloroflexia bacterium]|nr:ADP-forming succinate--CoA ligase subunit beta [Chloroflexia bacterium]